LPRPYSHFILQKFDKRVVVQTATPRVAVVAASGRAWSGVDSAEADAVEQFPPKSVVRKLKERVVVQTATPRIALFCLT
jgi:hypothetical protein